MHIAKWNEPILKGLKHSAKSRTTQNSKTSVAARSLEGGEGGIKTWSPRGFQGSEAILHGSEMMDTCHHTFVKTHRTQNTKKDLQSELWILISNALFTLM